MCKAALHCEMHPAVTVNSPGLNLRLSYDFDSAVLTGPGYRLFMLSRAASFLPRGPQPLVPPPKITGASPSFEVITTPILSLMSLSQTIFLHGRIGKMNASIVGT